MNLNRLACKLVLMSVLGASALPSSAFTFDGSDWLINGDAEATAAGPMNKTIDPNFGWIVGEWVNNGCTNTTVEVRTYASIWDMASTSGTDGWNYLGPPAEIRGEKLLVGGGPVTGNSGNWWVQGLRFDFWIYGNTDAISRIDQGNVKYDVSGWFGGLSSAVWSGVGGWSKMNIVFEIPGSSSQTVTVGGDVMPFRSSNGTDGAWSRLTYSSATGTIPVGTRRIYAFLLFGHDSNGWGSTDPLYNYGAADNLSFKVGTPSKFTGKVTLGDYTGDVTKQPVTIQIKDGGGNVVQTETVNLSASGAYKLATTLANGTYTVTAKASTWLRKKLENVQITDQAATGVDFALVNGDVDGDNSVTVFDYNGLSAAFDSTSADANWNVKADLDGDGTVTVFDYNILSANFDLSGD